jgi:hypothetical protein
VPPFPTPLPLWLALLLKRQRRANILPPPWLNPEALSAILDIEVDNEDLFSPPPPLPAPTTLPSDIYLDRTALELSSPFLPSSTSNAAPDALPYHWLELSHMLLSHASDDFEEPDTVRGLLRDLKEVRMAKLRKGLRVLDAGAGVQMNGVGALEIAESRSFIAAVIDGLRYMFTCHSVSNGLLTAIIGKSVLRENRRARKETPKMPRMAMLRAQSTTKTMTCYDKIPHIALFPSSPLIVVNSAFLSCLHTAQSIVALSLQQKFMSPSPAACGSSRHVHKYNIMMKDFPHPMPSS